MGAATISPPVAARQSSLAGLVIESEEVAFVVSSENQPTSGGQDARLGLGGQREVPDSLAGKWVDRANGSGAGVVRNALRGTANEAVAGRVRRVTRVIDARVFPDGHVEEPGPRAVRRRIPVRAALHAREDEGAFRARVGSGDSNRMALRIETFRPRLLGKSFAAQELARFAIEDIEETVAVGPIHELAGAATPLGVNEDRDLDSVPVMNVMRRKLKVPLYLPVSGLSATTDEEYRLSPGRTSPFQSGEGLPVPQ